MRKLRNQAPDHLARLMGSVGAMHFVIPDLMATQIPRFFPARKQLVYISGVVEVTCAIGLHQRAKWAPNLAALTLLAIWPANIQMALDAGNQTGPGAAILNNKSLMWGRVPLQLPLIWAALQARPSAT